MMLDVVRLTPHYPAAAGMRLLSGRWLSDDDRDGTTPVMVVNETFQQGCQAVYRGAGSVIGRQIDTGTPPSTIVGLISDGA